MLRIFFQLIRIPGIFTVFSNILIGYFYYFDSGPNLVDLSLLLSSSGLLFVSGMILNDFFDYDIDKKERPQRPLPSGKFQKNHAIYLGTVFLFFANIFSFFVGFDAFVISVIMSMLIIGYDYKLKFIPILGIFCLSIIRLLNVMLGFSIISINTDILLFVVPIAIFVAGISLLAKEETFHKTNKLPVNQIFTISTICYLILLSVINYSVISLLFLFLFTIFSLLPSFIYIKTQTQKILTFQLLSIIILDASLISIMSDYIFAIITALLFIPGYLITKKLYLT